MSGVLFEFHTSYDHRKLDRSTIEHFHRWREQGRLGFFDLPVQEELQESTRAKAAEYAVYDTIFVAGIGGSSLGLSAMLSFLGTAAERICLTDSPDSLLIRERVEGRKGGKSAICIITKSGGTAETLSIFMELRRLLGTDTPVIAITDPEKGHLRKLARERSWDTLPVPGNVGGRFSVLSPVGLFPGILAGMDTEGLLRGAETARKDFLEGGEESLAGTVAAAFLSRFETHPVHVFMPYSDRLFGTSQWFAQLWGESLGKARDLKGNTVNRGQTPLACRGPADQHSLVQLFMEGPRDKTMTILSERFKDKGKPVPGEFASVPTMAYLEGRSPDELRAAEADATAEALAERGLPVTRMFLPEISGEYIGQLFMALEIATVLCGLAMNIDPLDQPGVERGKILTYKAMGREGH